MSEERVILSERLEDLKKAVEWGREQKKKILNDNGNYALNHKEQGDTHELSPERKRREFQ